ncbi:MAG: PLP-dependent aminotransferase family protein [Oleiphilaceae bacterium]|nr:PLP-dependent aminotransferase family protein [Oleiphilaceae bacterium]
MKTTSAQTPLYRQLAETLANQIRQGAYSEGDKLPAIRLAAKQHGVSISTVIESYAKLQEWDLVEVRPKSGYYVCHREAVQFAPPKMHISTKLTPEHVSTSQLVMDVMNSSQHFGQTSLGAAIPSSEFPILHQLKRSFANIVRQEPFLGIGYDSNKGNPQLRQQIARRATEAGVFTNAEEVVITPGCQGAIGLCLRVLCRPGDIVAVESPTYYGLLQLIESQGLKALEIPTDPERGMSIPALRLALEQWPVKAILAVPNFSNPTGTLMPDSDKRELIGLLDEFDVPLIEDDIYGDLAYQSQRPKAVKSFDTQGRVLLCSSASKVLEPQLGLGWVLPGRYLEQIEYERFLNSSTHFRLPQMALAKVMGKSSYDRHLHLARETYKQRRDRLFDLVVKHFPEDIRVSQPRGGFVAWIQLPPQINATKLYFEAKEQGVLIAPGEIFSSNPHKYRHSIRLTYAEEWTRTREQAIATLGQLIRAHL